MPLNSNIPLIPLRSMKGGGDFMTGFNQANNLIAKQRIGDIAQQGLPVGQQIEQQLGVLAKSDPIAVMKYRMEQEKARKQAENAMNLADQKRTQTSSIDEIKQLAIQYRNARNTVMSDKFRSNFNAQQQEQIKNEVTGLRRALLQSEFGRKLVGMVDAESTPMVQEQIQEPTTETAPTNVFGDLKNELISEAKDVNPRDGIIDNIVGLEEKVRSAIRKSKLGTNDPEVKGLLSYLQSLKDNVQNTFERYDVRRKESKADEYKDQALLEKYQEGFNVSMDLKNNPNNSAIKSRALTKLLRNESGAAIARSEYLGRLQGLLPEEKYQELVNDLSGIKGFTASKFVPDEVYQSNVLAKYLPSMKSNVIINDLTAKVFTKKGLFDKAKDAYKRRNEAYAPKSDNGISSSNALFIIYKGKRLPIAKVRAIQGREEALINAGGKYGK